MRIAVVGTGGVGGYFGGRLAAVGHDVTFVARGAHLDAIQADGLTVESVLGDFVVLPAKATDDPAAVGPVELVIFAVKTWQLAAAAEQARPLFSEDTVALPLLNGVENADVLAERFGRERVLGGLCRILSFIQAPGRIRHVGLDPSVVLGELDNRRTERVERVHRTLIEAGIHSEIARDIHVAIWRKFLLISTWSGIGAVTRVPIGRWREVEGVRTMAEGGLREVVAVARARGVDLSADQVEKVMEGFDAAPADGTASMQRDLMAGRPSELEAQSGAVVRLGSETGIPTPVHAFLYHSLLPQERLAREGSET